MIKFFNWIKLKQNYANVAILLDGLNALFMTFLFGTNLLNLNYFIGGFMISCPTLFYNKIAYVFMIISIVIYLFDIFSNYKNPCKNLDTIAHHIITIMLITNNINNLGCIILIKLLHDTHNIIGMCRLFVSQNWNRLLYFVQSLIFILCRVIIFPILIYHIYLSNISYNLITFICLLLLFAANIKWSIIKIKNIFKTNSS